MKKLILHYLKRKKFLKIKYKKIVEFLYDKHINCKSDLNDNFILSGLRSVINAEIDHVTFFSNSKYISDLKKTKASACFIKIEDAFLLPKTCHPIIVDNPYKTFSYLTNLFSPQIKSKQFISKQSSIDASFKFGKNTQIGDFVSIKENTQLGDNCIILDNCSIGPNVFIASDTTIYPNNSISNTIIGSFSVIQSGCSIGDPGFGFFSKDKTIIQHIGNVIIGNNTNIGSNCTIDRATLDSTIIGNQVRIDNLVHIAHNVKIGDETIIAGQTGIAGGTEIGNNCLIGGQVGINGHITIGNKVTIAAKSGVTKSIADNLIIAGFPAIDIRKWRKIIINQIRKIDD